VLALQLAGGQGLRFSSRSVDKHELELWGRLTNRTRVSCVQKHADAGRQCVGFAASDSLAYCAHKVILSAHALPEPPGSISCLFRPDQLLCTQAVDREKSCM
jgi:hypothetical protein